MSYMHILQRRVHALYMLERLNITSAEVGLNIPFKVGSNTVCVEFVLSNHSQYIYVDFHSMWIC